MHHEEHFAESATKNVFTIIISSSLTFYHFMHLCLEFRRHPDTGPAITYPTSHGEQHFGGHTDVLAAFRDKMHKISFSMGGDKEGEIAFLKTIGTSLV